MSVLKTKPQSTNSTVLALYPNARGIGYAVMDAPAYIVESGMKSIRPWSSQKIKKQINAYLAYFKPEIILLQNTDSRLNRKYTKMCNVIRGIGEDAESQGFKVFRYTREQILGFFEEFNASSKHRMNIVIAQSFPSYQEKIPKERIHGDPEGFFQGEFDAISLALTHYYQQH